MIQLRKILIATDFSEHSQVAWKYALALAGAFRAEVIVCHVVEAATILAQMPPTGEAYFPPNLAEIQEEQARSSLEKLRAGAGGVTVRTLVRQGSAFYEIIQVAKEEAVDLIVLGTHGRGAIAHLLLGSVAERIVRKAPCPVLTVREGEHEFVMP